MASPTNYARRVMIMQRLAGLQRIRGDEPCIDVYRCAQRMSPNAEKRGEIRARVDQFRSNPGGEEAAVEG
jgi:hypothetical protein